MNRFCVAFACVAVLSAFPGSAIAQDLGDACTLLTAAEVSQALGVTVLPGHHIGASGKLNNCIFAPTAKFGPGERQIVVTVTPPAFFEASRRANGPSAVTAATVAGTEAYFQSFRSVTTIHVRKNGKSFEVRMNPGRDGHETQAQIEAVETSLAAKAAARV
jgi:hypothetical protein